MDPFASLVDWIALYGVFGLFAVGLAERFVPRLDARRSATRTPFGIALWNGVSSRWATRPSSRSQTSMRQPWPIKSLLLVLAVETLSVLIQGLFGRTSWRRTYSKDRAC